MGYRSNVTLVLSAEGVDALGKYIDALALNQPEVCDKLANYFDTADVFQRDESGAVMYLWRDVKWYSYDPEYVGPYYIEQFIHEFQDLCFEDCLFLRLGDEYRDVETIGELWNNPFGVRFHREIAYDWEV